MCDRTALRDRMRCPLRPSARTDAAVRVQPLACRVGARAGDWSRVVARHSSASACRSWSYIYYGVGARRPLYVAHGGRVGVRGSALLCIHCSIPVTGRGRRPVVTRLTSRSVSWADARLPPARTAPCREGSRRRRRDACFFAPQTTCCRHLAEPAQPRRRRPSAGPPTVLRAASSRPCRVTRLEPSSASRPAASRTARVSLPSSMASLRACAPPLRPIPSTHPPMHARRATRSPPRARVHPRPAHAPPRAATQRPH